ncbi:MULTISPECIES: hypothetical protein [Falsihalocynthiibacter]|uniref:hypothetical protein n=1 Tax=Falsihalocynthiibacter TaxID=2854182 RepID=UPI003002B559
MDFNQIISAQRLPNNQFRFDQDAMERSILRAEERRVQRRAAWQRMRVLGGTVAQYSRSIAILSLGKRHS